MSEEEEGYNPRSLLPTEVWACIFQYLKSPVDYLNCFYASKVFQRESWLGWEANRTTRLFPQVLKIYWEKFERFQDEDADDDDEDSDESESEDKTAENRQKVTSVDLVKTCRVVCKSWKESVDDLLQSPSVSPPALHTQIYVDRNHHKKFQALLQHSLRKSACWNPFPNRELLIYDADHRSFDMTREADRLKMEYIFQFREDIAKFLEKFGHHVRVFTHHAVPHHIQYTDPAHWYNTVRSWISHMPNLHILSLVNIAVSEDDAVSLEQLKRTVRMNPFPSLQKLRVLHVEDAYAPVIHSAVQSNPQLEKIIVNRRNCQRPWLEMGRIPPLNNLTTVHIRIVSMEEFTEFACLSAPGLKRLKVQMPHTLESISIDKCFKLLEKFKESLTSLDLYVSSVWSSWKRPLRLPHLKELKLYLGGFGGDGGKHEPIELSHLLSSLTLLEKVTIDSFDMGTMFPKFNETVAEFGSELDVEKRLGERLVSPLWAKCPNLMEVRLEGLATRFLNYFAHSFVFYRPH